MDTLDISLGFIPFPLGLQHLTHLKIGHGYVCLNVDILQNLTALESLELENFHLIMDATKKKVKDL